MREYPCRGGIIYKGDNLMTRDEFKEVAKDDLTATKIFNKLDEIKQHILTKDPETVAEIKRTITEELGAIPQKEYDEIFDDVLTEFSLNVSLIDSVSSAIYDFIMITNPYVNDIPRDKKRPAREIKANINNMIINSILMNLDVVNKIITTPNEISESVYLTDPDYDDDGEDEMLIAEDFYNSLNDDMIPHQESKVRIYGGGVKTSHDYTKNGNVINVFNALDKGLQ